MTKIAFLPLRSMHADGSLRRLQWRCSNGMITGQAGLDIEYRDRLSKKNILDEERCAGMAVGREEQRMFGKRG